MLNKNLRRLLPLLLIVLIFILPIVIAKRVFDYYQSHPEQLKTTNRGILIEPALKVEQLALEEKSQNQSDSFSNKWTLLYLNKEHCDEACQKDLYYLRQIHTATGKNRLRVQRVYATKFMQESQDILQHYRGTHSLLLTQTTENVIAQRFIMNNKERKKSIEHLFIVDPDGNVILHYPGNFDANAVLHDLKRLLRVAA